MMITLPHLTKPKLVVTRSTSVKKGLPSEAWAPAGQLPKVL